MCLQDTDAPDSLPPGFMLWLYRLQQRLSITRRESLAIASLLGLFLTGVVVQEIQEQRTPPLAADAFLTPHEPEPQRVAATADTLESDTDPARPQAVAGGAPASIDVNRATSVQLQALPGIGPALAGRIIEHRARRPFTTVDDLLDVPGIGPKTLSHLAPLVRITPDRPEPERRTVGAADTSRRAAAPFR